MDLEQVPGAQSKREDVTVIQSGPKRQHRIETEKHFRAACEDSEDIAETKVQAHPTGSSTSPRTIYFLVGAAVGGRFDSPIEKD